VPRAAAGVREQLPRRQIGPPNEVRPRRQRLDTQEHVAAALLARLDDVPLEPVQLRVARVDDAAARLQREERGRAEFGQLLDEELSAVALRQRDGHFETVTDLARRFHDGQHLDDDLAPGDAGDARRVFAAVAVEEADCVAHADAANMCKMVRLGPVHDDRAGAEKAVDVETIGHRCYFRRRFGRAAPGGGGLL
jgi:hypothetical protein